MLALRVAIAASLVLAALVSAPRTPPGAPLSPAATEILWDTYGIPHIYAPDEEELFRAFGWAQARNHGDLLLQLYGAARGRAAEYWGESHLDRDRWVRVLGIPDAGEALYRAQPEPFRRYLDAFAQGINRYAREHPEAISDAAEVVLPVTPQDVAAHMAGIGFLFSSARDVAERWSRGEEARIGDRRGGSNGWAIAPARSKSGHALLLANPHLSWGGATTFFEAHLVGPDIDTYGATLVGLPVLAIAFNDRLGWTHTVNTQDTEDVYELETAEDGYRWNGEMQPFVADTQRLLVSTMEGTTREETLVRRHSIHGPVIAERNGRALALRTLSVASGIQQWWEMARARSLEEFERALAHQAILGQNVVYADADGNILYAYGAATPRREHGDYDFWADIVPGDTSAFLWEGVVPYDSLPRVLNPPAGWVQNANDPPWFSTYPPVLDATRFPAYTAPGGLGLRPQRSIGLLTEGGRLSLEEMIILKHSTRSELADRILPELLEAAVSGPATEAASVLERWDRTTDPDSRGGVLFQTWYQVLGRSSRGAVFEEPWRPDDPLATPDGLADPAASLAALETAAHEVRERWGALDVAWGEVHRLRRDTLDLPANGGPGDLGIFRVASFRDADDGRRVAVDGDSYVAAIEFGDTVRARSLIGYGNASQPGSPHRVDQLEFFARKELRPVWRTRAEVEAHLEERTLLWAQPGHSTRDGSTDGPTPSPSANAMASHGARPRASLSK